jgi:TonB family protein
MTDITLLNLLIYSSQVLLVVAAAAIGGRFFPVSSARTRLTYWRAAVVACVILPFLPARSAHIATGVARGAEVAAAVGASIATTRASAPALSTIAAVIPWLLLLGAATRAAWLGLGLLRLRRLRLDSTSGKSATHVVIDAELDALRREIAPRAELRWHDAVAQPMTFGVRRPIVLLPRRVADLPPDARRAVVCHELLHVARHDWVWMIAEEIVRTAFWFHPAMWWALGQVQLSREQTVDEMVVALTAVRVPYMNALMMFADARPGLTSALPFVRRHQLASRLRQLSKEHTMSSLRLAFTGVVLAGVLIGSSYAVASAVPLRARPSRVQEPVKRQPILLKESKPVYPADMKDLGITAMVMVKADISAAGKVTRAEVSSWTIKAPSSDPWKTSEAAKVAPQPFLDAATAAVRQWTFEPGDSDTTVDIELTFTIRPDAAVPGGVRGGVSGGVGGGVIGGVGGGVVGGARGGVVGGVRGRVVGGVAGSARPGELPKQVGGPLHVGGNIKPPRKVHSVAPVYPDDAKAAHVAGVVIVEVTIAKDGSVSNARILRSVPMLDQAALDAVTQWVFEPTLLNGAPIEVVMTATVNFTMQ